MAGPAGLEQTPEISSVDEIVIPPGLLRSQSHRLYNNAENTNHDAPQEQNFDIQSIVRAQRGLTRATSITVGALQRTRQTGLRYPANDLGIIDESELMGRTAESRPVLIAAPKPVVSKRPGSISIAQLQRGQVNRDAVTIGPWAGRRQLTQEDFLAIPATAPAPIYGNRSDLFQDLSDYRFNTRLSARPDLFLADATEGPLGLDNEPDLHRIETRLSLSPFNPRQSILRKASVAVANVANKVLPKRRMSVESVYDKAKAAQSSLKRSKWFMRGFEVTVYLLLALIVYFVLIGRPLWVGLVYGVYWLIDKKFVLAGGSAIFVGLAAFYAFGPLLIFFEPPAELHYRPHPAIAKKWPADDTALLIPCYKSEQIIGATLEAALEIFPAKNIFVLANGNSPTPLDNTEAVCDQYGVNHTWSPIGSKLIAQYVGCYVAKKFPYALLIDDDCLLPPNFPVTTHLIRGRVKCIGYTIKSVGPNHSRGTYCQQAQDLEYKLSGLQRAFAGKIGSATFPHGAISLWDRKFLFNTFKLHPGFSVSEDWFFGHVARQLGSRIVMCTSVFVETETPASVFFSSGGVRGGFGEMTVFKQRFKRWNFFFVNGIYYNMHYILTSWKLGWWEIGAKLFVFQEVYETILYLLTPFVLPISFIVQPSYCAYLFAATFGLYFLNALIFNEVHLRMRSERVSFLCLMYYMPFKVALTFTNVLSCYWSLYKYAKYFAKRHPKVIEDEEAVGVVVRIERASMEKEAEAYERKTDRTRWPGQWNSPRGRRMTVTVLGTGESDLIDAQRTQKQMVDEGIGTHDFGV